MKKLVLTVCMLCFFTVLSNAQIPEVPSGIVIDFTTHYFDPTGESANHPRSPICPPEAVLSGHTLYILTEHPDYNLQLLSADGTVVYETYVPSTVNVIALPSSLSGEFEIQLQTDTYIFIGRIEL